MNFKYLTLLVLVSMFTMSCVDDDDNNNRVDVPTTYNFERDGNSTVSFSGQTTRIAMAEELASALNNTELSAEKLIAMFGHEEGEENFSDSELNASSKSVRSKTAASIDFFSTNATASSMIKTQFETWIQTQVDEVFPKWNEMAIAGSAGQLQEGGGGSVRYFNGKGLEMDQLFVKGLIGALMTDQTLNNYLSTAVLDEANNRTDNDNGVVVEGSVYTTMEHKWDEAFGYIYGATADVENANATIGSDDNFLNKYIGRVEDDEDFTGIASEIFEAFKKGRAAIVAKNYEVRDDQAEIIREKISEVIGIRAVYYLQDGKDILGAETPDYAGAFHSLSEGYGFIYSLQFTRMPNSNEPYFTSNEVATMLNDLSGSTNGLWEVSPETLQTLSETIASKFNFTVEQAR